jgi:aryl-alcohol dehydrogenase-like predicted oxidoreductase
MHWKGRNTCCAYAEVSGEYFSIHRSGDIMNILEKRVLGTTGRTITRMGLGGEGVLRTWRREREASAVIREAHRQGITYWDSARAYAGSEGYYGSFWRDHEQVRTDIFQTSKSARRDRKGALEDLETSLSRLQISHLDLWQIHDIRTREDLGEIEAPGGALEAFTEAKEKGRVSAIGVTGHHDPEILLQAVETLPVDTVLLPVNPAERVLGGFLDFVVPAARKRGMGVIGMKVLGAAHLLQSSKGVSPQQLVRFALGEDIDVAIVGCATIEEVQALAETARLPPLSVAERERLLDIYRPAARTWAYYRGTP